MSTITLPNIRVGSDLQVRARLKDGGVAIDWSTLQNIKACIYSDAQRALAGRCSISIDAEDPTLLVCNYAANKPQYLGANRVVISVKYLGETKTYDKPAFTFVRWTDDQAGEQITIDDPDVDVEIEVEDISSSILQEAVDAAFAGAERANEAAAAAEHMVDIHTGPEGKSAYEVAVEEGYTGTEEEWLASLVGPQGPQGIQGETGEAAGFGTVSAALQEDGGEPSVAVAASGTDTSKNFAFTFKNLKGDKGDKGDQGNTGSSVEYPYELVNNLTTNDATKGLTAAMGVTLEGEVSQLEAKVGDFADPTPTPTVVSGLSVGSTSIAPNANQTLYYIPVQAGVAFSFSAVYSDILRYGFTATTPAAYVAVTGYAAKNGASDSGVSHSFTPSADGYFCMAFKNDALVSLTIVPSVVPIGGEVYRLNQKVTALTPAVAGNAKDISILDEKVFGKELSETYNLTSGVNFSSPELEVNIPAGAKISLRITNSTNQDSHNCPVFFKDKDGTWNRVNAYNRYDNEFVLAYDAFKVYFVVSDTFISTDGTVLFELTNGGIVSEIDANTEAISSRDATVQTHTNQIGTLSNDLDGVEQDVSSLDQRVTTLENGGLEIKDEVLEGYVTNWLGEHPEATTTVEDGSVTKGKLASSLDNTITYKIYNKADLASFLSSSSTLSGRIMGDIVVDSPISVTDANRTIMEKKVLLGGSLYLQTNLFSNGMVNGTNFNLPNFVGVVFNGNGHNICYDDGYCVRGLFTNCVFLNCGLMGDGQFCQSAKFTNCRFLMSANHPFIDTYSGSDVRFTSCNWEVDNKATIVYMNTKTMDYYANFMKISFESCIMEGQGAFPLCSLTGGTVSFIDCYMEANNGEAVLFRTSSDPSPVANIYAVNTKLCGNPNGYIFYIPEDYLGSNLTCLVCDDCDLANGGLVNTTDLYFYRVTNIHIRNTANSSYQPSEEISKVDSVNSIVNFTNNTTCVVKKFPCLLSFETNESGYKGNLYYIDLLTGNTPFVKCVSDPSKTPSIAYDSGTGYCTVTLHSARTSSRSCSAIHLSALRNQLVANDTYGYRSQYDV